tara:strand:+ start:11906 stop:12397 length:492 start_codon:yes stop_codon:yes gene_type:complete
MTSFIKEASAFTNEEGVPCIEVKYSKYIEGEGYVELPMLLETTPVNGWEKFKSPKQSLRYDDFLSSMVEKNVIVRRTMARVALDAVLCENNDINSLIRVANSIKIIDTTFVPPFINKQCKWQRDLVYEICLYTFPRVIDTCKNVRRLDNLFTVLRLIEKEYML